MSFALEVILGVVAIVLVGLFFVAYLSFHYWIVGKVLRPAAPDPKKPPESYTNSDDALSAASRLDTAGDWDEAVALYQFAAKRWPERASYAEACIKQIRDKQSRV